MKLDGLSYEIEPGLLYGRPGPAKTLWNPEQLYSQGLRVVVSLVEGNDAERVADAGLLHYILPFEEKLSRPYATANPKLLELIRRFDGIVDTHLSREEPVLVHCNAGKDRTGILMAYYLIGKLGMKPKRAIKWLRKQKPDALTAKGYEDAVLALAPWMESIAAHTAG